MSIDLRIGRANSESVHLRKALHDRNQRSLALMDPFATNVEKYRHQLDEGARVRIVAPLHQNQSAGHCGVIEKVDDSGIHVRLDSGHLVHCQHSELAPENFDSADDDGTQKLRKSGLAVGDRVRSRTDGRIGKVTMIGGVIEIQFDKGSAACVPAMFPRLYERV
jgi:hypothetical protein